MAIAYLGIGSNLGNRNHNIEQAFKEIESCGCKILKRASIIETDPVGGPKTQGKFLNTAIQIETILKPLDLLKELKTIEKKLGRTKTVKDGPRIIDLDILIFENVKMDSPELTIPHPLIMQRSFVTIPLTEIAPDFAKQLQI